MSRPNNIQNSSQKRVQIIPSLRELEKQLRDIQGDNGLQDQTVVLLLRTFIRDLLTTGDANNITKDNLLSFIAFVESISLRYSELTFYSKCVASCINEMLTIAFLIGGSEKVDLQVFNAWKNDNRSMLLPKMQERYRQYACCIPESYRQLPEAESQITKLFGDYIGTQSTQPIEIELGSLNGVGHQVTGHTPDSKEPSKPEEQQEEEKEFPPSQLPSHKLCRKFAAYLISKEHNSLYAPNLMDHAVVDRLPVRVGDLILDYLRKYKLSTPEQIFAFTLYVNVITPTHGKAKEECLTALMNCLLNMMGLSLQSYYHYIAEQLRDDKSRNGMLQTIREVHERCGAKTTRFFNVHLENSTALQHLKNIHDCTSDAYSILARQLKSYIAQKTNNKNPVQHFVVAQQGKEIDRQKVSAVSLLHQFLTHHKDTPNLASLWDDACECYTVIKLCLPNAKDGVLSHEVKNFCDQFLELFKPIDLMKDTARAYHTWFKQHGDFEPFLKKLTDQAVEKYKFNREDVAANTASLQTQLNDLATKAEYQEPIRNPLFAF